MSKITDKDILMVCEAIKLQCYYNEQRCKNVRDDKICERSRLACINLNILYEDRFSLDKDSGKK